jgi:hypothetical protein
LGGRRISFIVWEHRSALIQASDEREVAFKTLPTLVYLKTLPSMLILRILQSILIFDRRHRPPTLPPATMTARASEIWVCLQREWRHCLSLHKSTMEMLCTSKKDLSNRAYSSPSLREDACGWRRESTYCTPLAASRGIISHITTASHGTTA